MKFSRAESMMQAEDTSRKDEPPSTIHRKQAIGRRQRAYETKRRINNEETVAEHIAAWRQVKRIVKQEKRNKELSIARICKHNPKSFYSYINERRIVRDNIGHSKLWKEFTTDNDMANIMNNYFRSVFTIEQLNNVTQLHQYEGNIFDTLTLVLKKYRRNCNI